MKYSSKNKFDNRTEPESEGVKNGKHTFHNLTVPELYEHAITNKEAILTDNMALRVLTGKYTGRSPKDRFFVETAENKNLIDWGGFNQPIGEDVFDNLYQKITRYLNSKKVYVKDLYCGADPDYRLNVKIVSEAAYHALFSHNMFINPPKEALSDFKADFTVLAAPNLKANPETDGTRSDTFILCHLEKKLILIGGTLYSGEVKKGIFSVMNYLLPQKGVMPMHCSANMDKQGNTAVFFGLSGTGKTTLSADASKILIGDDEHGWSENGVFNFEGGCYAKTIHLSKEHEPEIYQTTQMPGTILENVVLNEDRHPDFDDDTLTQNTRCCYPIHFIPNASESGKGNYPKNVIFLTADAFGILPPISRLTPEQAMYHFMSGYTAKVAGTERGITEPEATFSACFGAPFMPLHPSVYAELLAGLIKKHKASVWLVNTGWTGGIYGTGKRMPLKYTRKMLQEAITGNLNSGSFLTEPVFGLNVPEHIDGVPKEILMPKNTWKNPGEYDKKAKELADMFRKNFEQFSAKTSDTILNAGPVIR